MRVLVTCQPGIGHFRPVEPFARALVDAGHDVMWATSRPFVDHASGPWHVHPMGLEYTLGSLSVDFDDVPPPGPERLPYMADLFGRRSAVASARSLEAVVDAWQPHVILRDYLELGAALVGASRGLRVVTAGAYWGGAVRALSPFVVRAAEELGLGLVDPLRLQHGDLLMPAMPPGFTQVSSFARTRYVRPHVPTVAPVAASRDHRPLVHVTLGTTEANHNTTLYRRCIEAGAALGARVVAAVGHHVDIDALGTLPEGARVVRFADHDALLPQCSAVITHGGYGTLMSCMGLGVPVVVIPQNADQPANAGSVTRLGIGLGVGRDPSVEQVRNALAHALSSVAMRRSALQMGQHIRALPGPAEAVDAIVAVVRYQESA